MLNRLQARTTILIKGQGMSERAKAILARLGTKPMSIEPMIFGGTVPFVDRELICAACAGANDLGIMLCFAKYANDKQAAISAMQLLERRIAIEQGFAEGIARLIISQEVNPAIDRCPSCGGRGVYGPLQKTCKRCEGAGRLRHSESKLARLCNIDRHTFRNRKLKALYGEQRSNVQELEVSALYHIDKRLFG